MEKIVFEDVFELETTEDSGQSLMAQFDDNKDDGLFVRVQSWDETLKHEDFNRLVGKKVRITIEVIE